jgi:transmembrane sensor
MAPEIDKYVDAARRELRVRAWNEQKHRTAFRELMRRRGARGARLSPVKLAVGAFAAAAAILLAVVALRPSQPAANRAAAPAANGLQRIALGEGTEVSFERGAQLDVRERSESRVIVGLRAGAARFNVRHDPQRFFLVQAADVEVEDNGTTFAVENNGTVVTVSVSEGSVSVSFPPANGGPRQKIALRAGERGVYPARPVQKHGLDAHAAQLAPAAPTPSASNDPTPTPSAPAADWRALARAGNYPRAYDLIAPTAFREVRDEAGDLLLASDAARLSQHPAQAATLLRQLVSRHPRDPRAPSAAFTLGWVLMNQLGRPREAALAFAQAESLAPRGNLAEDASARAVEGWYRAGDLARARAELERYRSRYPQGRHLATLQRLAGVP